MMILHVFRVYLTGGFKKPRELTWVTGVVLGAGVAALLFGPKKLPEIGKSIGKTVKSFQQVCYIEILLGSL
jgi:TatA/E family protein of Tat protein translocase